ncbi:hypothetical protein Scep_010111 [Stephania cephalantha]|uniref:Uncharacterized protein n=1 Tax=Stephania cephalantha TaxID=152367 RepID=A0AAP0JWN7_9MAGN
MMKVRTGISFKTLLKLVQFWFIAVVSYLFTDEENHVFKHLKRGSNTIFVC